MPSLIPRRKWKKWLEPSPPPVLPSPALGAFARREVLNTTVWQAGTGAGSNVATVMFRWQDYETSENSYSSTVEDGITDSIDDGCANDYAIVIRVFAGSDAPCGRSSDGTFPDWMLTSENPVEVIETKANDSGGGATEGDLINIPLAWDANYRGHYQRLLQRLNSVLNGMDQAGHPRKNHILYIPASMPTELGTEMTLGYGSFDPTFNRAAWDTVSTQTQRRAWYTTAWQNCLDDHQTYLPNVRRGLAGGNLWSDAWAGADTVVQLKGGPDVVCMTTSLKDNYPNLHPNDHDFLLKGKAKGCYMGIQTAGESGQPQGQSFVDAAEFALETYDIKFFETYTNAFSSATLRNLGASGDWPGANNITTKTYLVNHAFDLQSRLVS